MKTKTSLEVHFRRENVFCTVFFTSSQIEKKTNLARIVQLTSLRNRKAVASELFFFHIELRAKNTNTQHRHIPFAISEINFSETL